MNNICKFNILILIAFILLSEAVIASAQGGFSGSGGYPLDDGNFDSILDLGKLRTEKFEGEGLDITPDYSFGKPVNPELNLDIWLKDKENIDFVSFSEDTIRLLDEESRKEKIKEAIGIKGGLIVPGRMSLGPEIYFIPVHSSSLGGKLRDDMQLDDFSKTDNVKKLIEYFESDQEKECNDAIDDYQKYVLNADYNDKYTRDKLLKYFSACKVDTYVTNIKGNISEKDVEKLKSSVGVFSIPCKGKNCDKIKKGSDRYCVSGKSIEDIFCNGYRIDQNHILTARHCLGSIEKDPEGVRFTLISDDIKEFSNFEVIDGACNSIYKNGQNNKSYQACDYVILKAEKYPEGDFEPGKFLVQPPKNIQFKKLIVIGYNTIFHAVSAAQIGAMKCTLDWQFAVVSNKNPLCMVYRTNDIAAGKDAEHRQTCIQHGCQTTSGMSGSPMFIKDTSGNLEFIGIHIGGTSKGDQDNWQTTYACNFNKGEDFTKWTNLALMILQGDLPLKQVD